MNKRQQKYFAYHYVVEFTHHWETGGKYLDIPYYQFFTRLFDEELVENTVIVFFSDHGVQLGPLRETHSGEMETRLPFMFIRLPENTDSFLVDSLMANKYRLTTPFDIHATMIDLLINKPDPSLPHGLSLIDSVLSDKRDCTSAGIPPMYCSCYDDTHVLDYELIHPDETIPKIIAKINSYSKGYRKQCVEYEFQKIKSLYERVNTKSGYSPESKTFLIQLYVKPGNVLFSTIIEGQDGNKSFEPINGKQEDTVIRISEYGNQTDCLYGKPEQDYCFCRDML